MKVNFIQPVADIDDKFMSDTFADYAVNAVNAPNHNAGLTGAQLLDKFELARTIRFSTQSGIEISNHDKAIILDEISRVYASPIIYKRFVELFEIAEKESKEK
jgi:hypothetical protein